MPSFVTPNTSSKSLSTPSENDTKQCVITEETATSPESNPSPITTTMIILSWKCPGHDLGMTKRPETQWTE